MVAALPYSSQLAETEYTRRRCGATRGVALRDSHGRGTCVWCDASDVAPSSGLATTRTVRNLLCGDGGFSVAWLIAHAWIAPDRLRFSIRMRVSGMAGCLVGFTYMVRKRWRAAFVVWYRCSVGHIWYLLPFLLWPAWLRTIGGCAPTLFVWGVRRALTRPAAQAQRMRLCGSELFRPQQGPPGSPEHASTLRRCFDMLWS